MTYYVFNAHGDVIALVGGEESTYAYDAFGRRIDYPDEYSVDGNPFRYCGEYFDDELGTVYLRARYYDPGTGRFLSEDPIRDGLNWYAYCAGNPVMWVDPSGMLPNVPTVINDGGDVFRFTDMKNVELGNGWWYRWERADPNRPGDRDHLHIFEKKGKGDFSQDDNGKPHHKPSGGLRPPNTVLKQIKEETGWDWKEKENDFLNKVVVERSPVGVPDHFTIVYPDGLKVYEYFNPKGFKIPTNDDLLRYYNAYGFSEENSSNNSSQSPSFNSPFFFFPIIQPAYFLPVPSFSFPYFIPVFP